MPPQQLPAAEVLRLLTDQPVRIRELTKAASPAELRTPPADGEWSANEVLAHLRACADMWGGSIEKILAADHPTFRVISPRTWVRKTNYPELDFATSFRAFVKQRKELLARLEPLSRSDWSRAATITGAGRPLERTVHFYAQWLATHERPHVMQIARALETAPASERRSD